LAAAILRCNLCADNQELFFNAKPNLSGAQSTYDHGTFVVSGSDLPATIRFQFGDNSLIDVNTIATPVNTPAGTKIAKVIFLQNGDAAQGLVWCRYSKDAGATWSAWLAESPTNTGA
jgi:hypothetical protein